MSAQPGCFRSEPGARVAGELRVPGDKSISHRAAILGALGDGVTDVEGFLEAHDCESTLAALAALGVRIERPGRGCLRIHGVGIGGLARPRQPLDLGNSGTGMRLLAGVLAGHAFTSTLVGDSSLMVRPMERVAAPLRRMGADVRTENGTAPVTVTGTRTLRGCVHRLEVPSAQVKSAVLLAGLHADGTTCVREPGISRDHTERMLAAFGVEVARAGREVCIEGPAHLRATRIDVPGDFSSAAFFIVAALVAGSGPLLLRGVGVNPTRTALIDILRLMGADIRVQPAGGHPASEPFADIEVHPSALRGVQVPPDLVPIAIDEMPVLFAAAALASGQTAVRGAGELRVKESDRLAAMADGLEKLGVAVDRRADGLSIRGGGVSGGEVDTRGDHRIAMAFAILGARARSPVVIRDVQNVGTSFPGFAQVARSCGLRISEEA